MSTTASDTTAGVSLGATGTGDSGSGGNSESQVASSASSTATGSQDGGTSTAAWYGTLEDQGLKQLAETKGWKSAADALKSYKELETAYSSRGEAPKPPALAGDYKFEVPADIPESAYDKAFDGWFREASLKLKVPQELAAGYHKEFVEYAKGAMKAQTEAHAAQVQKSVSDALTDLTTKWGQQGTPSFTKNLEMAKRAIRMADPAMMDTLKSVGAIVEVNGEAMIANATLFKVLATMGQGMYAEDTMEMDAASDKNPFDDKTEDTAMQGRLIKNDPDKAALLIKAAGKEKFFHQFMSRHKAGARAGV